MVKMLWGEFTKNEHINLHMLLYLHCLVSDSLQELCKSDFMLNEIFTAAISALQRSMFVLGRMTIKLDYGWLVNEM